MPLILRKLIQPLHLITNHTPQLNDRIARTFTTGSMSRTGDGVALALDDDRVPQDVQLSLGE